ncbi:MAG: tetratricopeptide repeat protein [Myxococcota bacterium]|nr:tetratricopeptide repeat protein [Myxococcota bacterium]
MLWLCARPAHADDSLAKPQVAAARDHLSAGNKLYRLREFEKAVEAYKAGALVEDVPVFHYNLGQCYRQLGRYEDAIWHYDRFLERGKPTGQIRDAVESFRTQMKGELEKKAMTQPPVEPAPEPKPTVEPPKTTVVRVPAPPWYEDTFGWVLAVGGAAGIGASAYLFVDANALEADADMQIDQGKRDELRQRASSRRTTGVIVGLGSVALLATGVVRLALRPDDRDQTVTTSLNIGVGTNSVFVVGRF